MPKGPSANPNLAAMSGNDNVTVKPLVKHVLSKELQLYFERICSALLDESNNDYRLAALASIRSDPGLHQLVPYFVQFIAEKVTHNLRNLFVLTQMMQLTSAMLENKSLFVDPYVICPLMLIYRLRILIVAPDRLPSPTNSYVSRRQTSWPGWRHPCPLPTPPSRRLCHFRCNAEIQQIISHAETAPRSHLSQAFP